MNPDFSSSTAQSPMILQRRRQISAWVQQHGSARVSDLSKHFAISEVTIRNDLAYLEEQGELLRDRGGAVAVVDNKRITSLLEVEKRAHLQIEEKRLIAQAAAATVESGDTIIMDAGTTVVEMAPFLAKVPDLTVVTNALNVALSIGASTPARVILLGGVLNRESSSSLGSIAERTLADLRVDKLFLGTQAFDHPHGLTDTTLEIAEIKKNMIRASRKTILLADSAKWGSSGFIKIAPLSAVHSIITDPNLPPSAQTLIQQLGIKLTLAGAGTNTAGQLG